MNGPKSKELKGGQKMKLWLGTFSLRVDKE